MNKQSNMASSFITKDNIYGFWLHDSLIQVVSWVMVNVVDQNFLKDRPWLREFRDDLFNNSQGMFVGFMSLRLNDFIITPERKQLYADIINEAKKFVRERGNFFSPDDLNSFQLIQDTKHEWTSTLPTKEVIKIFEIIEDLINDKLSTTANDTL